VLSTVVLETPLELLRRALADVEDHHGQYTAAPYELLSVHGVDSGLISEELLRDFGLKGFRVENAVLLLSKV